MAKDPAILFYTSDFISGTITMSHEQRGKYILLLCIQHQKGYLTEKDMLNICNSYDEDIWCKFKKEGENYYNERMRNEAEKRANYAESRRNNRKKKETSNNEDMKNISFTYDKHMENENVNINKDINKEGGMGETKPTLKEIKAKKESEFRAKVSEFKEYPADMLKSFCDYWTESGEKDKKLRYEKQDVFDISRRLVTWQGRIKTTPARGVPQPSLNVNSKWGR